MEESDVKQGDPNKYDSHESQQEVSQSIQKVITENPDSYEIGTPGKGGAIKVYGNFDDLEAFKKKVDNARAIRDYANQVLTPSI